MSLTVYRLKFKGPIHISDPRSDYGAGEKIIHSDTFYAALIAAISLVKNDPPADLGCTISSLFPYTTAEDGNIRYFFPKPLLSLNSFTQYNDVDEKKLKRLEWIEKEYFEQLLSGKITLPVNESTVQSHYLCASEINKDFLFTQTVPRVAVPRSASDNGGDTNIFYVERTYFTNGSGLYFLAEGKTLLLEQALNLLQHEGIGTDRNVGYGHFEYEKDSFLLLLPGEADYSVSLSLINPGRDDLSQLLQEKAAWEITRRGGWITTAGAIGIRKRSVYMFTEGSIFSYSISGVSTLGIVDFNLKPEVSNGFSPPGQNVWRCGRGLLVPVKLNRL